MTINEPTIVCPHCKHEIKLTESLAAPLLEATRQNYEYQLAEKDQFMAEREKQMRERENALKQAESAVEEQVSKQVEAKLQIDRQRIAAEEAKKAQLALSNQIEAKSKEVNELQEVLKLRDLKLAEAQLEQANLLKKQRELDDAKRELELTIEKRVQEMLNATRDQARKEAEGALKLRVMEKDQTIASMQQKIEELKQKAEQGSQQLQGEVQELELESLLRARFPFDSIEPVAKGEFGGDVLHRVVSASAQSCGEILWESKRTKNWSDGWLSKLREDQRSAKAEVAVLVTHTLPKGVDTFDVIDGVWVTSPKAAIPVATVLRQSLIQLSSARQIAEGQHTKTEMVYQYLTGPRFKQRVEAIVEAFTSMQEDLDRERKAIMKQWAKREEQIERVVAATVGMYGDLQGIAGRSMQEIDGLGFDLLEARAVE